MELVIPALPQGHSAGSNRCHWMGEVFGNLTASVQASAANLLQNQLISLCPGAAGNQTRQGFPDLVLGDTRSLRANHLLSRGHCPQATPWSPPGSAVSWWDLVTQNRLGCSR